jgi:hypothetical protein
VFTRAFAAACETGWSHYSLATGIAFVTVGAV